jgi:hypothetical protein
MSPVRGLAYTIAAAAGLCLGYFLPRNRETNADLSEISVASRPIVAAKPVSLSFSTTFQAELGKQPDPKSSNFINWLEGWMNKSTETVLANIDQPKLADLKPNVFAAAMARGQFAPSFRALESLPPKEKGRYSGLVLEAYSGFDPIKANKKWMDLRSKFQLQGNGLFPFGILALRALGPNLPADDVFVVLESSPSLARQLFPGIPDQAAELALLQIVIQDRDPIDHSSIEGKEGIANSTRNSILAKTLISSVQPPADPEILGISQALKNTPPTKIISETSWTLIGAITEGEINQSTFDSKHSENIFSRIRTISPDSPEILDIIKQFRDHPESHDHQSLLLSNPILALEQRSSLGIEEDETFIAELANKASLINPTRTLSSMPINSDGLKSTFNSIMNVFVRTDSLRASAAINEMPDPLRKRMATTVLVAYLKEVNDPNLKFWEQSLVNP